MLLQVRTKKALRHEDMFARGFYVDGEIEDIKNLPDFWGWSNFGFYREYLKLYVVDLTIEQLNEGMEYERREAENTHKERKQREIYEVLRWECD